MQVTSAPVKDYYEFIRQNKATLLSLYRDCRLERKQRKWDSGWTSGYRLFIDGELATGSSIGEDEIRLFLDLPNIVSARYMYCVGVAFGLSTFCFALAKPDNAVFGIDDYSERPGEATNRARVLVEEIATSVFDNVFLPIGRSPVDTVNCLNRLPKDEKLSILFIDGEHTDEAAAADFNGAKEFVGPETVVLWHDVYDVKKAFADSFSAEWFDRSYILRTYGVLGIYFNSTLFPALDEYLRINCLIWEDWEIRLKFLKLSWKIASRVDHAFLLDRPLSKLEVRIVKAKRGLLSVLGR